MTEVARFVAGTRLGRQYVLRDRLGRGATGTVWRAESAAGAIALKILHPHLAGDAAVRARFLAEREVLIGLTSRHLVAVRDVVVVGDVVALVLDLIEGSCVRARLQAGPVPPQEAAAIVAGVCSALATVHAAGVVHRDVKPENVLLASDGRALLTDFGSAFVVGQPRATGVGLPAGTAEYVAPELAGGAPPTPAADIYSVGILLYELLSGTPPFQATDPVAVLYRHVHDPVPMPTGASPALGDLARRCLAKDPARRPTAHEAVAAAEAALPFASRPTNVGAGRSPIPEPAAAPPARGSMRCRTTAAAALAGVLSAGVVLTVGGLTRPAVGRAGAVPTLGETYPAPTGWVCPAWQPLQGVPGAAVRPCILGSGGHVGGRVQLRGAAGPVDLEWSWHRWTGTSWQASPAVRCRPLASRNTCVIPRVVLGATPTALAAQAPGGPPGPITPAVGRAAVTFSQPP